VIEVRIPVADVDRHENEVLRGQVVLTRLRDAGIPAYGILWLRGVAHGVLRMWKDDLFDDIVYQWEDATL